MMRGTCAVRAAATVALERLAARRLLAAATTPVPASAIVATGLEQDAVVEVAADGKVLVARPGFLHRYTRDLTPDTTFGGGDGIVELTGAHFPIRIVDMELDGD